MNSFPFFSRILGQRSNLLLSNPVLHQEGTGITEIDLHVAEFFYVALLIFFLLPFIAIYFIPKNYTTNLGKRGLLKLFIINLFFVTILLIVELISNPTRPLFNLLVFQPGTSEFFIVGFLWLIIYVTILIPVYLDLLKQSLVYEVDDLSYKPLKKLISESIIKLRGREIVETQEIPSFFRYRVPGSYYLQYNLSVLIGDQNPNSNHTQVHITVSHSTRNKNMIKTAAFITFAIVLLARAQWTLTPVILSTTIDSEITFTLLVFIFIFFNILITYSAENLIFQRETAHKKVALEFNQLDIKKPKLNEINIEDLKQRAKQRLEFSTKKIEVEKQKKLENFLGKSSPVDSINPEIIRMEALIRETRTILNSTPALKSISIADITDLLGGKERTSEQELESIIIGLIKKAEVKGEYDIWTKIYKSGNPRNRFINRTLENINISKKEIANLKVSGELIEVSFWNPNEDVKTNKNKEKKINR